MINRTYRNIFDWIDFFNVIDSIIVRIKKQQKNTNKDINGKIQCKILQLEEIHYANKCIDRHKKHIDQICFIYLNIYRDKIQFTHQQTLLTDEESIDNDWY